MLQSNLQHKDWKIQEISCGFCKKTEAAGFIPESERKEHADKKDNPVSGC